MVASRPTAIRRSLGSKVFDAANDLFMVLVAFVMLYPFLYVASASLSDAAFVQRGDVFLLPKGLNLDAYRRVLADPWVGVGYWNTVKYTVVQTAVTVALTALTAYPLSKQRVMLRRPLLFLIGFTMLFEGGLIPRFLVVKQLGLYNTFWALIIPGAVNTFYLFLMRTFFLNLPRDLEEAAQMDGAGPLQVLLRIVVPVSMPLFATIALFTAVAQWNAFFGALIFLVDKRLYPLQIHLRNVVIAGSAASAAAKQGAEHEEVIVLETIKYATIMVATLPILFVYPFLQKYFVKGVMLGSIKE